MNVTKTKPGRSARPRSGRPTKEQAGQITGHIIDVATRLFRESSFESISIDLIAATARISKQTFYARFASKEELYVAVIRKSVDSLLMPAAGEADRAGPIEVTLIRIGVELSRRALTPAAVALNRLVTSESHQFPQLALILHESAVHTRELIADIFSNAMRERQIRSVDAGFLAEQFLYAVVDGHTRSLILSGKTGRSEKDLRERVVGAVGLFLDGCRDHPARRS
jgi:TetR/AcrR family transcriptional repressor of mexJK operon